MFLYFAFARVCMCCMCVAIYFVYVCMYYRGSTQYRLAFCVTPVMYMWLKLIIIIIIIIIDPAVDHRGLTGSAKGRM